MPLNNSLKKPKWLRVRAPSGNIFQKTKQIIKEKSLNTVCESAACPNIAECWNKGHATFIILGNTCTRACKFCNIKTGIPDKIDPDEPKKIANSIIELNLKHVVITSVDRDDLRDGGAQHFARCILEVKKISPSVSVEVLTPDFLKKGNVYKLIVDARPEIFNHNIETVPSLYLKIRPGSRYFNSLNLLNKVKEYDNSLFTKSGLMVGLGETNTEVLQVMDDLRSAGVDFLTIGQYLQPTTNHADVKKYVSLEEFQYYEKIAYIKGFTMVSATPLTRSSYHADADFMQLKQKKVDCQNHA